MATCLNDPDIPDHMEQRLADLKKKQKEEYSNVSDDHDDEKLDAEGAGADVPIMGGDEEESGSSGDDSEDDEPPAKRVRLARVSVDAHVVQEGMNFDLDIGRISRSMSRLSRSSRASSIVSLSGSVHSIS